MSPEAYATLLAGNPSFMAAEAASKLAMIRKLLSLDASVTERVVLLDSLLYVAQSGESSAVWVRPFVQLSADDDDD